MALFFVRVYMKGKSAGCNWWLYELNSLGISTLQKNGLDNHKEAFDMTEAVKQTLYEDYLQLTLKSN